MADVSERGFVKGAQWLVWRFESDATLADAMQVGPGSPHQDQQAGAMGLPLAVLKSADHPTRAVMFAGRRDDANHSGCTPVCTCGLLIQMAGWSGIYGKPITS